MRACLRACVLYRFECVRPYRMELSSAVIMFFPLHYITSIHWLKGAWVSFNVWSALKRRRYNYMRVRVSNVHISMCFSSNWKQRPDHLPGSLPFSQISTASDLRLLESRSCHHSQWLLTSADDPRSDKTSRLYWAIDTSLPIQAHTHKDDGLTPFYSACTHWSHQDHCSFLKKSAL